MRGDAPTGQGGAYINIRTPPAASGGTPLINEGDESTYEKGENTL